MEIFITPLRVTFQHVQYFCFIEEPLSLRVVWAHFSLSKIWSNWKYEITARAVLMYKSNKGKVFIFIQPLLFEASG